MTVLVHLSNDGWPVGSGPVRSRPVGSWGNNGNWSWAISWGWGWGVDGLTRVLNISNVTSVGIRGVGDSLKATIGKGNVVFSLGGIAIAGLRSSKVGTAVSIGDSVVVVVGWDSVWVGRLSTIGWGRGINWGRSIGRSRDSVLRSSGSNSHKSKQSNKALKEKILFVDFQSS